MILGVGCGVGLRIGAETMELLLGIYQVEGVRYLGEHFAGLDMPVIVVVLHVPPLPRASERERDRVCVDGREVK